MPINADKPHLWKKDIAASVDLFNGWFMKFAPKAYRESRAEATRQVEESVRLTDDLRTITPRVIKDHPGILPALRMATCPPLARDRLMGLAYADKNLIKVMEEGRLPPRMSAGALETNLKQITRVLAKMLDADIFPWLSGRKGPSDEERHRASTIVADRLCGAVSDPIIRNAQEKRQLAAIGRYLRGKGYAQKLHPPSRPITDMEPGTFNFRLNVIGGTARRVRIPIDVVVQPKRPRPHRIPVLIEAKSAGDFTNVNKRRKEEATKIHQLRDAHGPETEYLLFLCGYFDSGYLGYEAAEGIDWIWEHRMADLDRLAL